MIISIAIFGFVVCGYIGLISSNRMFVYCTMVYLSMLIFFPSLFSYIKYDNPLFGWSILIAFLLFSVLAGRDIYYKDKLIALNN